MIQGGRCRLPQQSGVSVGFQSDAFYSGAWTDDEQAQNEPSHCKTKLRPVLKENPGALAGATGANSKAGQLQEAGYRESDLDATWRLAKDRHKRAAGMILCSLIMGDESPETLPGAAFVLRVRLTTKELVGLAFAALRALDPEPREMTFEAAHWGEVSGAGAPMPPWFNVMDDARWWASYASRRERKAYCLAAFEAMPPADQSAFLRHVQREGAHRVGRLSPSHREPERYHEEKSEIAFELRVLARHVSTR